MKKTELAVDKPFCSVIKQTVRSYQSEGLDGGAGQDSQRYESNSIMKKGRLTTMTSQLYFFVIIYFKNPTLMETQQSNVLQHITMKRIKYKITSKNQIKIE